MSKRDEGNILPTRNASIFIYPNQHGGNVFVQTADDENMLRTGFELPAWIVGKALQILQRTTNHGVDSSHTLEADTLRKKLIETVAAAAPLEGGGDRAGLVAVAAQGRVVVGGSGGYRGAVHGHGWASQLTESLKEKLLESLPFRLRARIIIY